MIVCFQLDELVCLKPRVTDIVAVHRSDTHCEWVHHWSFLTSPRVIVSHTPSARVISTFDFYLLFKVVAGQVLQFTECLGRRDRSLRAVIQSICSSQEEQLAAEAHKRQRHQ